MILLSKDCYHIYFGPSTHLCSFEPVPPTALHLISFVLPYLIHMFPLSILFSVLSIHTLLLLASLHFAIPVKESHVFHKPFLNSHFL